MTTPLLILFLLLGINTYPSGRMAAFSGTTRQTSAVTLYAYLSVDPGGPVLGCTLTTTPPGGTATESGAGYYVFPALPYGQYAVNTSCPDQVAQPPLYINIAVPQTSLLLAVFVPVLPQY